MNKEKFAFLLNTSLKGAMKKIHNLSWGQDTEAKGFINKTSLLICTYHDHTATEWMEKYCKRVQAI